METSFEMQAVGPTLAYIRDQAEMSQAALSKAMGSNTTRVFRMENADAGPGPEEIDAYLLAVGSPLARDFREYLGSNWKGFVPRPTFPHPNWRTLQIIDEQLARIEALKADPETKAVFVRALDLYAADFARCATFLQRVDHQLVFVGIISVGKTSAICTSTGLVLGNQSLPFARRMVLEVGGGRVTLCEVRVQTGPDYGLIIEPCTDEEVRRYVMDYADQLLALTRQPARSTGEERPRPSSRPQNVDGRTAGSPDETPWVPEEVARAIRGLSSLSESDASNLAQSFPARDELAIQILSRMDLLRRRDTVAWRKGDDQGSGDLEWLQKVFKDINNGRRSGFSLPKRITVVVPRKLLANNELRISVVDTKGIDHTSVREDIDAHLDDPHATVLLCTKFGEAPDLAVANLLRRARTIHGDSGLDNRLALLILPRNSEALDMKDEARNDFVESAEAGYAAKLSHVTRALQPTGADNLPIQFLNATVESDIAAFRTFVLERISALRQDYVDKVTESGRQLDSLMEHRTTEERAIVFTEVMGHLRIWTDNNRSLLVAARPHEQLSQDISSAHPRTLWASLRREGAWENFNYYYHLGSATRQVVAVTAGDKVKNLKAVIENLASNPEYAEAKDFLKQISDYVDSAIDQLGRQMQLLGQTLYRDRLHAASAYWQENEDVYGTANPFRSIVANNTRRWFGDESLADLHQRLDEEINRGWQELVDGLANILESPAPSATSVAA